MVMLLGLFAAQNAYPWGDTGHEIICEIAFQELTPQARTQVKQLLQQDPDFMLFSTNRAPGSNSTVCSSRLGLTLEARALPRSSTIS